MYRFPIVTALSAAFILCRAAQAHPGAGIEFDSEGRLYFTDTAKGLWEIQSDGQLERVSPLAWHWLAADLTGRYAGSTLPEWFSTAQTPASNSTLILCSDFPLTTGADGLLYYANTMNYQPGVITRVTPDGRESKVVKMPKVANGAYVTGITGASDGNLYVTVSSNAEDVTEIWKVNANGKANRFAVVSVPSAVKTGSVEGAKRNHCRDLVVDREGNVFAACVGSACVLKITPMNETTVVLQSEAPWTPTGVTLSNGELYALEYDHTGHDRENWVPRIRKVSRDGKVSTVASLADSFRGATAGEVRDVAGVTFCWCPAGNFTMGSPRDEPERRPGENQVDVTLTRGFWMGQYEVTQGLWNRVMGSLAMELDQGEGETFPIYNVNFAEIEEFCREFTWQLRASGDLPDNWEVRMPTEAQWEYACRAGTTTATAFGDSLSSKQANFLGDSPYNGAETGPALNRTCEVGRYPANPWNLYDMHGNVFEWCRDWYHHRMPGGIDPDYHDVPGERNVDGNRSRVRRGGCWADEGWPCRSAFRLRFEPERKHSHIGFRVVVVER